MLFLPAIALSFFVVLAFCKPLHKPIIPRQTEPLSPDQTICGDIVVAAHNDYTVFFASTAFECLSSVPFNGAVATRFLNYYNTTVQFQSTLAYLKDPPADYQQPAVDVQQVLEQIQRNVTAGVYKSQYEFEADVQILVNRVHDTHVTLDAGILNAFSFLSPYGLVSVSKDGKQLPEVYLAEDLNEGRLYGYTASPVTRINNQDVVEFLTEFAESNAEGYLEPHADWNSMMDSPAGWISGDLSIVQSATLYPGDELTYTFQNGSELESYWLASYNELGDTGPLTTAGDFYNYFVLGLLPDSYNSEVQWWPNVTEEVSNDTNTNTTVFDPVGEICARDDQSTQNWCRESFGAYPKDPAVAQADLSITAGGVVTGYFLHDISTGVLSIPSFYQFDPNTEQFDLTIQYFIRNATQNNISRVVIDLQTNSGGSVYLAYNTFKQFFYRIDPYAASRIRSHELADVLGSTYSKWWKDLENDFDGNEGENRDDYEYSSADEWVILNRIEAETSSNFSSWADYHGKVVDRGDSFSAAQRYNLSDEIFDDSAFQGWIPYGYGIAEDKDATPQVWAPEDIVILTDGMCASACALFVEFMTNQAGVRTVTVGGRPSTGPMQAVSGSRGVRVYDASELDNDFAFVTETIENTTAAALLPDRTDTGMWVTSAGINIRDQVRKNDNTPLQFKYEAADCRIYYTLDNIFNMTRLWHDAAKAAWDDTSLCVEGSTGFPTARNTNSTRTPPARTAQVPSLNLNLETDPSNPVGDSDTNTTGLWASSPKVLSSDIIPCTGDADCDGTIECLPTPRTCKTVTTKPKYCLPPCSNHDPGCPGTSVCDLDLDVKPQSKTYGGKGKIELVPTFSKPLEWGHCRPSLKCKKKAA